MRVIAIGGIPGSGKSTLIKEFIRYKSDFKSVKLDTALYGVQSGNITIFGVYDEGETFPGTDRLSMSVQPVAVKCLESIKDTDSVVLFEGDRLFNASFLTKCLELSNEDFYCIMLKADQNQLAARYSDRGSNQSEQFIKSRMTKLSNIESNLELMPYISIWGNETKSDLVLNIQKLNSLIEPK